jgi:hypothetical protein
MSTVQAPPASLTAALAAGGVPPAGDLPNMSGVPNAPVAPVAGVPESNPAVTAPKAPQEPAVPIDPLANIVPPTETKVEPKVEPKVEDTGEVFNLADTGNAQLDASIQLLCKAANVTTADVERAVGKALENSDARFIDEAFIREKFGDFADHALELAKATLAEQSKQSTAIVNSVYEAAGGQQNWEIAVGLFNSQASPSLKNAVSALLNGNNAKAGADLVLEFAKGSGHLPQVGQQLTTGVSGTLLDSPLSAAEFRAEYSKLSREAGTASLETGVFGERLAKLQSRRAAGVARGL